VGVFIASAVVLDSCLGMGMKAGFWQQPCLLGGPQASPPTGHPKFLILFIVTTVTTGFRLVVTPLIRLKSLLQFINLSPVTTVTTVTTQILRLSSYRIVGFPEFSAQTFFGGYGGYGGNTSRKALFLMVCLAPWCVTTAF
jgi:hypothetical protein